MGRSPSVIFFLGSMAGGGAERVALLTANRWAEQGIRVTLMLVKAEGVYLEKLNPLVEVIDLVAKRTLTSGPDAWRHMRARPGVPVVAFGLEIARICGIGRALGRISNPLVYREPNHPILNSTRISRLNYLVWLPFFNRVLAQNHTAMDALRQIGVNVAKVTVADNPTRLADSITPVVAGAGGLRLVAVGRLSRQKGFDRLVSGMAAILQNNPDATLTIFGEGPDRQALQSQIDGLGLGGVVRLAGFESNQRRIWEQTDVLVMSSYFEGQSNALIEAMAAGVRLITTSAGGGSGELLRAWGLAGCLIDDKDFTQSLPVALTAALSISVEDWAKARGRFRAQFDFDFCCEAYARIILDGWGDSA